MFYALLSLEKISIIVLILLSILTGMLSLLPPYFQQSLIKQIINGKDSQQYIYFGIIVCASIFRFLIFNVQY
jgi:hypothetical protein